MELYYNATKDGLGLPGILNYTNSLVSGWLVNSFLIFIFIVMTVTGMKSEWKTSSVLSASFLLTFITGMMLQLITTVNPIIMYCSGIGLAISVFIMIMEGKH